MGNEVSTSQTKATSTKQDDFKWINKVTNDYELAIRLSKELEYLLEKEFKATGRGLHEKITTGSKHGKFSQTLVKRMRFLATIRNKLIHERGFNKIPDRDAFIKTFDESVHEIRGILQKRTKKQGDPDCVIL